MMRFDFSKKFRNHRGRLGVNSHHSSSSSSLCPFLIPYSLRSSYLPLGSLCIHPGVAAWCLYLDVVVLSYDAGILDSAVLGAVAALRDGEFQFVHF